MVWSKGMKQWKKFQDVKMLTAMKSALEAEWYYAEPSTENRQQQGPVSGERIVEMIDHGYIDRRTLVWTKTMKDWKPIRKLTRLYLLREEATMQDYDTSSDVSSMVSMSSSKMSANSLMSRASARSGTRGERPTRGMMTHMEDDDEGVPLWETLRRLLCCVPPENNEEDDDGSVEEYLLLITAVRGVEAAHQVQEKEMMDNRARKPVTAPGVQRVPRVAQEDTECLSFWISVLRQQQLAFGSTSAPICECKNTKYGGKRCDWKAKYHLPEH
eukprot:CAMPEP_0113944972 /NCGR_PEP_ID=MMETSP1339-20121228/38405_1 /TAXON_ID=94617 /ORGANISM="Fibrocapsa japonica" /LENGTH=270 /DNA_ID=CAMNT_0000950351 /DNA_START=146 /DNA_END=959 /DNA_ORIENTATION=+ /assembly_acc=CAM_ASM_000762